ncbi:MAG: UMP kinase [Candidatus Diapherotrites archaeon]|nr:UMP kinase [Candidatus Diapherotrites archaeon]
MDETVSSKPSPSSTFARSSIFVVSIGGSVLFEDLKPDVSRIREIASAISNLSGEGYKFGLVVGGGSVARSYIAAGKELSANNFALDELGISITRANAFLFLTALEKAHPFVLTDLLDAKPLVDAGKVPVFGGIVPGFTTDAVGVLLAEKLGATFVNLSNVDGIYSSNPTTSKRARMYRELSFEKLFEIVSKADHKPGQNFPVDFVSAMLIRRSRIPSLFLNANNMENFRAAIQGRPFVGTHVSYSEEADAQDETGTPEASEMQPLQPIESDSSEDSEIVRPKKKNPDDYFPF